MERSHFRLNNGPVTSPARKRTSLTWENTGYPGQNLVQKKLIRPAQTRKHCCRNIWSQCCMGEQTGKTQILRLQDILLEYANEETFGKHSKSVFLQCFPSDSSFAPKRNICCRHEICVLKAKIASEIFQKHSLRPGHIFASATMFPCLCRP